MILSWWTAVATIGFILVCCNRRAGAAESKAKREMEMTDDEMMKIMREKGVPYIPNYMAPNQDVARKQFPNMIQLTENYEEGHTHRFSRPDLIHGNQKSIHWLLKEFQHLESHLGHTRETSEHVTQASHFKEDHGTTDSDLVNKVRSLAAALQLFRLNVTSKLLSRLLPGLDPSLLLGERHKREVSDDEKKPTTETQYCKQRGSQTSDGSYLRMCSTCAATTTLPSGHFPRVINEVICSTEDRGCLTVNGITHGRCKQKVFHLNMLRAKNITANGTVVLGDLEVSDRWEVYTQPIRVSCECEIDKLSMFSRYIAAPPPTSSP